MKIISTFVRVVDKVNRGITRFFGYLVIALNAVLMYGVIMRYLFHHPVHWEGDIAWLIFIIFSVLSGGYVYRQDGHVRLDVIYGRLNPVTRAVLDVITFPCFLFFMGLFSWFAIKKAWWSIKLMETNPMSYFHGPIYPARIALAIGAVLLLFQGIAELIRSIARITGHKING